MPAHLVSLARSYAGKQVRFLNLEKDRAEKELSRGVFGVQGQVDQYRLNLRNVLLTRIEDFVTEIERINSLTDEQAVREFCTDLQDNA